MEKDMFDLADYKPDDFDKNLTTYQCLTQNTMMFLELASEKTFKLLDGCFDGDDEGGSVVMWLKMSMRIAPCG